MGERRPPRTPQELDQCISEREKRRDDLKEVIGRLESRMGGSHAGSRPASRLSRPGSQASMLSRPATDMHSICPSRGGLPPQWEPTDQADSGPPAGPVDNMNILTWLPKGTNRKKPSYTYQSHLDPNLTWRTTRPTGRLGLDPMAPAASKIVPRTGRRFATGVIQYRGAVGERCCQYEPPIPPSREKPVMLTLNYLGGVADHRKLPNIPVAMTI